MRKQIVSMALVLCMATALLPSTAFAADAQKVGQVTIAGKTLTNGMGWNNNGSTTNAGSSSNNAYLKDGVLYLTNANIKSAGSIPCLSVPNGDLTISVSGENYLDQEATSSYGMVQAVTLNADENENTAGNILIQGDGMLEVGSVYDGIVNKKSQGTTLEIKDASVSVRGENHGMDVDSAVSVAGGAMLVATAQNRCMDAGSLSITEYAAVHAESDAGRNGEAIVCDGLESKGYLAAYGDTGAIRCEGNADITGGTVEARVRRNPSGAAIACSGKVSTNGMYVHAGISSLDAKQVQDFDTSVASYRYAVIVEDSSWLKWENGFEDVKEGDWYYDKVSYVNQHGLMNGVGGGRFEPGKTTSRCQAVQILYALSMNYFEQYGIDCGKTASFQDVPSTAWYAKAVGWAGANGVVSGIGNNQFAPNRQVIREEFVQILFAFSKQLGYDTTARADLTGYQDHAQVSDWARDAMQWAVASGVISGTNIGTLNPQGYMTRAEAATMITGFIGITLGSGRS